MEIDLLNNPEKYIPQGIYCYDENGICLFWEKRTGQYPKHEDGFCIFLNKSDWDINEEVNKHSKILYHNKNIITNMFTSDLENENDIDPISGKKIHMVTSLMWDKIKSCDINDK